MVRRRHVYHLAGYDPVGIEAQYRRFARQLDVFRSTWNVQAILSDLALTNDRSRASWTVRARGVNWQTEAVHEVWLWDDIVRKDLQRPLPARLLESALAYFDFIATGTMVRYLIANQRYAAFFLFPLLALAMFLGCAWCFSRLLTGLVGLVGVEANMV